MGCGIEEQPNRPLANKIVVNETTPCWVDRQRMRRIYQSLATFEHTRSPFLLEWAQDELMHIVRDA